MEYQKTTWRVIEHAPAQGAWNMAVDETILESVYSGDSPPTLRLFGWKPACLSLGHAQPFSEVNQQSLKAHGWEVVRRPTGGRAILHVDELTYSVIAPETEPRVSGGVLESYLRLSEALMEALKLMGLKPEAKKEKALQRPDKANPVCFEVPSYYEITVDGRKLIGSAQARRKEGILQHGTLPLYGDLGRIIEALNFDHPENKARANTRLFDHATTVERVLGKKLTWDEASQAFQQAFENTLNLELKPGSLTKQESLKAQQLVDEKYAHPSWTERI